MKLLLKFFAVLITVFGYYGSKADKFNFVLNLIAKSYVRAKEGIKILLSEKGTLLPSDKGFYEITSFIRTKLQPIDLANTAVFEKLKRGVGGISFGVTAESFIQLEIYIQNNPVLKWDLKKLERELEDHLSKRVLRYSTVIFWFGVFLNTILILNDLIYSK